MSENSSPFLTLRLLGEVSIQVDGKPVPDLPTRKAEALLIYLACQKRPYSREVLAELLWDDRPQDQAFANLRSVLSSLRREFEPFLTVTRQTVAFNTESHHWLDTAEFLDKVASLQAGKFASGQVGKSASGQVGKEAREQEGKSLTIDNFPSPPHLQPKIAFTLSSQVLAQLQTALGLYRGNFLVGFYLRESRGFEEWVSLERERLQRAAVNALHLLIQHHLHAGDYPAGIEYAARLLVLDNLSEETHRQMMLLLARNGQRNAALAHYDTCCRILADELGVTPAPETTTLYERIRSAQIGHNLPAPASPFVGREVELVDIQHTLANPTCRLFTLLGTGGIGKTRLALQVAHALATNRPGMFLHGIWHVPLTAVSVGGFLPSAIAQVLNFSFYGNKDPAEQLIGYLREKELLLVLDNFEHLLEGDAGGVTFLNQLLQETQLVKLLVTSRERLDLYEEWVFDVPGLSYPSGNLSTLDAASTEIHLHLSVPTLAPFESYDAVQLFLQNARRLQRTFTADALAIIRICQLLDGLPLGIELAATWVRQFTCEQIAQQIEGDLDFLATTWHNAPARHRSLRAVFDHSWNLLSSAEQRAFRRLAVFRGGFSLEAARQVAGLSTPLLVALVNKSLLRRDENGRYELHDLLRQYATVRLNEAPAEAGQIELEHSRYYTTFLHHQETPLRTGQQKEALSAIGLEIEDIRHAWQTAVSHTQLDMLNHAYLGLYRFYEIRGWFQEGETTFRQAAAQLETIWGSPERLGEEEALLLGRVMLRQGWFLYRIGQISQAKTLVERCRDIFQYQESERDLAQALNDLGILVYRTAEYTQARQLYLESLAIRRQLGDRWDIANTLSNLSLPVRMQGEYAEARQIQEESLAIRRELGDRWGMAISLHNLGEIARAIGEMTEARRYFEQSLTIRRELGDRMGIIVSLNNLGSVAHALGGLETAQQFAQECVAANSELGTRREMAYPLCVLGRICRDQGDFAGALTYYQQALSITKEFAFLPKMLDIVFEMATLLVKMKQQEQAAELFSLVIHHPKINHETQADAQTWFAQATAELPPTRVIALQKRGREKDLETAVAELLNLK